MFAAYNSWDEDKDKADFILTENPTTNMSQILQFSFRPSSQRGVGMKLVFTEGHYPLDASVGQGLRTSDGFSIEGAGTYATYFDFGDTARSFDKAIKLGTGSYLRDLSIDGTNTDLQAVGGFSSGPVFIERVEFLNAGVGVYADEPNMYITDCLFFSDVGIWVDSTFELRAVGNYFEADEVGIRVENLSSEIEIARNTIYSLADAAIELGGASGVRIVGNFISAFNAHGIASTGGTAENDVVVVGNEIVAGGSPNPFDGIHLSGDGSFSQWVIVGNRITSGRGNGIGLTGAATGTEHLQITGNTVRDVAHHGIMLDSVHESVIADNLLVYPGSMTDNTYDGIQVDGDGNTLQGNVVISDTGANEARYGINIVGGTANTYVGNRARGTFGTAAYNDSGTSSVNTWPAAGGAQGDNLT